MKSEKNPVRSKNNVYRFLLTYVCILLPVLAVSLFVSTMTLNALKDKEYHAVRSQLNSLALELDSDFVNYKESSVLLSTKLELLPHRMLQNAIEAQKGIEVLNNAIFFSDSTYDVAVYYGTDEIYCAKGHGGLFPYFNGTLDCDERSTQAGIDILQSESDEIILLNNKSGSGYLFLHFPVQNQQNEEFAHSVNYCISLQQIGKQLEQLTDTNPSYINLVFADGNVVHYYGEQGTGLKIISDEQYPQNKEMEKYTNIHQKLTTYGLSVEVLYQTQQLFTDVQRGQFLDYFILICGLLFSTGAAWAMSKRRYEQIHTLEKALESGDPQLPDEMKSGELDHVRSMIVQTIRQSNEWHQMATQSFRTLKSQTATMIFQGLLRDRKVASEIMQFCGLEPLQNCFFLGGIQMECSEDCRKNILQLLSGDLYCEMTHNDRRTILFLLGVPDKDPTRRIRLETADKLGQLLNLLGATRVRIAMSHTYTELEQADIACLEVTTLLDHFAEDLSEQTKVECSVYTTREDEDTVRVVKNQLDAFSVALEKRDYEKSVQLLRSMDAALNTPTCTEENQRYLRYCILQPLIQGVNRIVSDTDNVLVEAIVHIDPADGSHFGDTVIQIIRKYCDYHNDQDDFKKIVAYIEANYVRDDLTQEEVADYAGVSRTAMSKLFRAKTGICYMDYITELRMRKAKELLMNSNIPIAEVFRRVGYVTRSNYTKKFKSYYGINASDVRRVAPDAGSPEKPAKSESEEKTSE